MTYPSYGGQEGLGNGYQPVRPGTGRQPLQPYPAALGGTAQPYPAAMGGEPTQPYPPATGSQPAQQYPPATGAFPAQHYGGAGAPQAPLGPPRKRNTTALILSIALAVALALTGTFLTLYIVESGDHKTTAAALESNDRALTEARSSLNDAQSQLDEANRKVGDAERSRDDAQAEVAELTKCRDATRAYMQAIVDQKPDIKNEVDAMVENCA
jgi:uncharacterized protein HemX